MQRVLPVLSYCYKETSQGVEMIRMTIQQCDEIQSFTVSFVADNDYEINEFKATLSKSLRKSMTYGEYSGAVIWDKMTFSTQANGTTGAVNEAGFKRVETLKKKAAAFGIQVPETQMVAHKDYSFDIRF